MKTLIAILISLCCYTVYAQKSKLTGKVESNGIPVLATVNIKENNLTTGTEIDGTFAIATSPGTKTLEISAIGYKTLELSVVLKEDQTLVKNIELKEDILGLNKVVVTATRGYLDRKKAPVIVTVTDAKVLEATQAISLSEGLNFQPGLRMETNCQNCGTSEVKMNGLNGSYSQILIDSRPIFSALNSVYGLDQIPANIIKQIEVVRGGGSALYGSNAIAGTINIITKDPLENSFSIGTNLALIDGKSEDKTLLFNGTVINKNLDTGIALFGMKRAREAFDYDNDGFTEITQLENTSFGLKAFTRPNDRKKITAEFNANNEFRRGGNQLNLLPFLSDVTEQIESTIVSGGLTYEYLTPSKKDNYSVYASTSFSKNKNFYGGLAGNQATESNIDESIEGYGNSEDITFVTGAQYAHKFDQFLNNTGTFTGGIEYKYNDIDDRKENPDFEPILQTTHLIGVYAQQEWVVNNNLRILGGLRADKHNLVKENIILNPRANILYNIHENLRWRFSYAKGFRAPQIYGEDVHASLAAGEISRIRNDDDLKSETSHSLLTSLDWSKELSEGDFSLVTEAFYTQLNDAFALEQGPETAPGSKIFEWIRSNSSGAKVYGLNIETKYAPNKKWLAQAGATIQRALYDEKVAWSEEEQDQATREFNKTPNFYANFVITHAPIKEFQNNVSGVFTSPMHVQHLAGFISNDKLEKSPSFFELNWKSSYQFYLSNHQHTYLEVSAGIQNIFNAYQSDFDQGVDRDVSYIYGPQRPRTVFVGCKFGL
ncbi:TonB-dependent receptor [Ochrovirga pacifica]|uniref:TonB-dependent receptor n=1 Tax=Ochrovirga pacifica TaxID=1042376 RepID=UPI000255835E|nr:TonB-dependent receptor [Ochrovirga pacifica]